MIISSKNDEDVLDQRDQSQGPEDETEDSQEILLGRVFEIHRRHHVERRCSNVPIDNSQRLVGQQQCLPCTELLQCEYLVLSVSSEKQINKQIGSMQQISPVYSAAMLSTMQSKIAIGGIGFRLSKKVKKNTYHKHARIICYS